MIDTFFMQFLAQVPPSAPKAQCCGVLPFGPIETKTRQRSDLVIVTEVTELSGEQAATSESIPPERGHHVKFHPRNVIVRNALEVNNSAF